MEKKENKMGERPVFSLLISMSLPMMLSMLVQALYNIVDSMYVSRLGTQALTAVSLAYPLQNIVVAVSVGIGVGISSALSISLGEKNQKKANETATMGMALTLIHCILFVVFGLLVTRPFLNLFTDSSQVLENACDYTYIVLCVSFGSLLQIALEKIYQGIGAMKTTMVLLATGCIINIILDPILIFGLFGVSAMGVKGAAIATVAGQIGAFLLYIVVYLKKNPGVTIHPKYLKKDWKLIKRIYSVGIPSSLMLMMPSLLVGALNGILAGFSEVYVAVLGVYFKLQTFIYMPANGMIQGMRPIIGYNYGAGQYERVRKTIRYCLFGTAVIMILGTLLSLGIPEQIFRLFQADEELLQEGETALRIISLGFLISSVGTVFSGVFEALGRGGESLAISLLRQLVITVPLGFVFSCLWGAKGIWIAFPVSEAAASFAALILLRRYQKGRFFPLGREKQ